MSDSTFGHSASAHADARASDRSGPGQGPRLRVSEGFASWLHDQRVALAVSSYQTNRLILIGSDDEGRLRLTAAAYGRCTGLHAAGGTLWVAGLCQLWRLEAMQPPREGTATGETGDTAAPDWDRLYLPQTALLTGLLNVHDLAVDRAGRPIFVNTLFNCLATSDATASFRPLWRPPFISDLVAEDRCHLNGLAVEAGVPRYVTAFGSGDLRDSWRGRVEEGCLVDVQANEVVVDGLAMPHSPRLHVGRLWLHLSATGEFGVIEDGRFKSRAALPGFLRGLAFVNGCAVVGLSRPRQEALFQDLPLGRRLADEGVAPVCGLAVIDLASGRVQHSLEFRDTIVELYDVAVLHGCRLPGLVAPQGEAVLRHYSVGAPPADGAAA